MRLIDAERLKRQVEGRSWRAKGKMVELIDNSPTVEPAKHGRWETEVRTVLGAKVPFFACSVCGSNADDEYAYCPNCGAVMEEQ